MPADHRGQQTTSTVWGPESWRARLAAHQARYEDQEEVERTVRALAAMPPLVTSWEVERLKNRLADVQAGRRFLLQGGDCAERLEGNGPQEITSKVKILLQMALVLAHGGKQPVVRVGRIAGQYAKPRSNQTESRTGSDGATVELPSYFGDLVNGEDFTPEARKPDPERMLQGYQRSALTLNFLRALTEGGFADMHHPEYWDLGFVSDGTLSEELRDRYRALCERIGEALRFSEAIAERSIDRIARTEFFASHEGLNLLYESAQTRTVPHAQGHYCLTTHLPWIGERTRALDGAHVEFFRGVRNPVGVKVGPTATPEAVVAIAKALNPENEPGKLVLIVRMGAGRVREGLPPLIEGMRSAGRGAVWVSDPMHGNTRSAGAGVKTRRFDDVLDEVQGSFDAHREVGSRLGGVHVELTGEHVTECVGGGAGVTEGALCQRYESPCDPRLNYAQSLELSFRVAERLAQARG